MGWNGIGVTQASQRVGDQFTIVRCRKCRGRGRCPPLSSLPRIASPRLASAMSLLRCRRRLFFVRRRVGGCAERTWTTSVGLDRPPVAINPVGVTRLQIPHHHNHLAHARACVKSWEKMIKNLDIGRATLVRCSAASRRGQVGAEEQEEGAGCSARRPSTVLYRSARARVLHARRGSPSGCAASAGLTAQALSTGVFAPELNGGRAGRRRTTG